MEATRNKNRFEGNKEMHDILFIEYAQLPHNEPSVGFFPQVIDGELTKGGDIATLWPVLGAFFLYTHTLNRLMETISYLPIFTEWSQHHNSHTLPVINHLPEVIQLSPMDSGQWCMPSGACSPGGREGSMRVYNIGQGL